MATTEDILSSVRKHLKQCPDITILDSLYGAINTFCRDSWWYQKTLLVTAHQDQNVYEIDFDNGDELIAIQAVQYDDRPLVPARQQDYLKTEGEPVAYQYEPPNYLVINPAPTEDLAERLKVRCVLQRVSGETTIPDAIYRHHEETLIAGTLAGCFLIPDELWTDLSLGQYYDNAFKAGVQEAKRMRHRGFVSGSLQMRRRSFL